MKKECSISISLGDSVSGNKIPAIKLLRAVEPMGLREAKELIEDMDWNGTSHTCFLSTSDIILLREFGFRVKERYNNDLPEKLFSLDDNGSNRVIGFNNMDNTLKITTTDSSFSVILTAEEIDKLRKDLYKKDIERIWRT